VKRSLFKKGMSLIAMLAVAVTTLLVTTSPPAHAAPPDVLAFVGSDTTEDVVEKVLVNPDPNGPSDNGLYNVGSRYDNNTTEVVPGEAGLCNTRTYYTPPTPAPAIGPTVAPNGSTAGRNALAAVLNDGDATNDGCIDGARSSSTPRTSTTGDRLSFQYSAWGIDLFSWSSASLNAPTELTLAEIKGIYNCTYTDWSQVGGAPGAIQRVLPQSGSGSYTYWTGTVLGFDPATFNTCPAVIQTRDDGGPLNEHAGREVPVSAYQTAIFPYSGGQWGFQANSSINPTLDKRNGFRLGLITAEATFTAATTNASTTLSSSPLVNNRFTNINLGASVTGPNIPAGTTITAISANGQTATMSAAATGTGSAPGYTVVSLPSSGVRWLTSGTGSWLPNTPTGANPRGAVTESQIRINNPISELVFLRYMFNVVDSGSPQFVAARAAFGFQNTAAGVKSTFCDGSSQTKILDGGFAPLSSTTPQGVDPARNLNSSTCRAFVPLS
jgi:phosphate transport system substrate-binding protein